MDREKLIKLLGLNSGIAAANIITFSPGLIGLEMGGSALAAAFGIRSRTRSAEKR